MCLCLLLAAANMTDEDKAAMEQQMTSVKDACYDAVVSGVLHVFNKTAEGKELNKTEVKRRIAK